MISWQKYFEENRSTLQEGMFENKGFTLEVFWNIACPIKVDCTLLAMTSVNWNLSSNTFNLHLNLKCGQEVFMTN